MPTLNWTGKEAVINHHLQVDAAFLIHINPSVELGSVKPVNGVGQPPMIGALGNGSMLHYLQEAGVPCSRLHDVGGWLGQGLYVDIPNLFPDFEAVIATPKLPFQISNCNFKSLDPVGHVC